jgi:hypothetical protein
MAVTFRLKTISRELSYSAKLQSVDYINKLIDARISEVKRKAEGVLRDMVEYELRRTNVIKNLVNPSIGTRGYDLEAEFGLYPGQGEEFAEMMINLLKATCRVEVIREKDFRRSRTGNNPVVEIKLRVFFLNPEEYETRLSSPPFQYTSQRTVQRLHGNRKLRAKAKRIGATVQQLVNEIRNPTVISWGKWLMNASRGDNIIQQTTNGISNFGISYDIDPQTLGQLSRSGRALMVHKNKRNLASHDYLTFPYHFPLGANPEAGRKNFVDQVARSRNLIDKLNRRMNQLMDSMITNR